jgi:hypothetical protein
MSRFKGTRRLRGGIMLGLASLALAAAPGALGTDPKPPPKPPGASVQPDSSAADQYAPPRAAVATTARARRIGLCKRAVVRRFTATRAKCKNAKCRAKAQRDQAVAMKKCNTLIRV